MGSESMDRSVSDRQGLPIGRLNLLNLLMTIRMLREDYIKHDDKCFRNKCKRVLGNL